MNQTKKLRVNINDFTIKDLIGKGYFGEVYLAVEHVTHDVYAIKKMPKTSFAQSKEERNILANNKTEWLPSLYYAFQVSVECWLRPSFPWHIFNPIVYLKYSQDETYLYLAMEYMPGGDLFSLMSRNNTFTEDVIQFYLAEITLALNALHSLGFVHRDIKPENILIDRLGHLKLVDFGSAVAIEKDGHVNSFSLVGTPDYIGMKYSIISGNSILLYYIYLFFDSPWATTADSCEKAHEIYIYCKCTKHFKNKLKLN